MPKEKISLKQFKETSSKFKKRTTDLFILVVLLSITSVAGAYGSKALKIGILSMAANISIGLAIGFWVIGIVNLIQWYIYIHNYEKNNMSKAKKSESKADYIKKLSRDLGNINLAMALVSVVLIILGIIFKNVYIGDMALGIDSMIGIQYIYIWIKGY